jgi:hypothetical protein
MAAEVLNKYRWFRRMKRFQANSTLRVEGLGLSESAHVLYQVSITNVPRLKQLLVQNFPLYELAHSMEAARPSKCCTEGRKNRAMHCKYRRKDAETLSRKVRNPYPRLTLPSL